MDVWAQLWPIPYKNGKAHKSVISDIKWRMGWDWTFQTIMDEVVKAGITDEDDQIATTRALVAFRDENRRRGLRAITA